MADADSKSTVASSVGSDAKDKKMSPSKGVQVADADSGSCSKRKRDEDLSAEKEKPLVTEPTAHANAPTNSSEEKESESAPRILKFSQPVFGSSPLVDKKTFNSKARSTSMSTPTASSLKASGFVSLSTTGKSLFGTSALGSSKDAKDGQTAVASVSKTKPSSLPFSFGKYSVPTFQNVISGSANAKADGNADDSKSRTQQEDGDLNQLPVSGTIGFVSPIKKKRNPSAASQSASAGKKLFEPAEAESVSAPTGGATLLEQRTNKVQNGELAAFECMAKVFAMEPTSGAASSSSWVEKGVGSIMILVLKSGLGGGRIVGHRSSTGRVLLNARILPGPLVIKDNFLTLVGLSVNESTNEPERKSFLIKPLKPTGEERLLVRHFEEQRKRCPFDVVSVL